MKNFLFYLRRLVFGPIAAAFIIAAGWQWYHFPHHPHWRIVSSTFLIALAILFLFKIFKIVFHHFLEKTKRHWFWRDHFYYFLDEIFFIGSLYFLVFFSSWEWLSLIWFTLVSLILFWRFDYFLSQHSVGGWRRAFRIFFIMAACIFFIQTVFQYFAYSRYILDSNIKFSGIVLFRSMALAAFWLGGYSLAGAVYVSLANRFRYAFLGIWSALFILSVLVAAANAAILYQSSLYFNPVVFEHAAGGGLSIYFKTVLAATVVFVIFSALALWVTGKFFKARKIKEKRIWLHFDFVIVVLALAAIFSVASFKNTPEATILKSFYDYWRGANPQAQLSPIVQQKLEKFGIFFDLNNFYINEKEQIYSSQEKLLPDKFNQNKPNVVIVFLESYSSRLTGPYNEEMKEVTPGLNDMAETTGTTKFKNVYNASTPTVTGLISELCSFLPPTGHNEIEQEKHLQNHHLLCLPDLLLQNGFKSSLYITAVEKDFANKDSIFASMGVKEVWGTNELAKKISGEPLAWGYSDHQMFPVLFDEMKLRQAKDQAPFLIMLSTVDTHPPFNLAKDEIKFKDGENALLNAVHTTDDAFFKFWQEFKSSEFFDNTIVVAIADHAIFPTAYEKKFFPDLYGKMTFYDEMTFLTYIPDSILPKEVDTMASGMDLAPTLAQIIGINEKNTFEGHSIFDDRERYPNLLGMHEFGLWINQTNASSTRQIDYSLPTDLRCGDRDLNDDPNEPMTLCDYYNYFEWKRLMLEEGRLWSSGS